MQPFCYVMALIFFARGVQRLIKLSFFFFQFTERVRQTWEDGGYDCGIVFESLSLHL